MPVRARTGDHRGVLGAGAERCGLGREEVEGAPLGREGGRAGLDDGCGVPGQVGRSAPSATATGGSARGPPRSGRPRRGRHAPTASWSGWPSATHGATTRDAGPDDGRQGPDQVVGARGQAPVGEPEVVHGGPRAQGLDRGVDLLAPHPGQGCRRPHPRRRVGGLAGGRDDDVDPGPVARHRGEEAADRQRLVVGMGRHDDDVRVGVQHPGRGRRPATSSHPGAASHTASGVPGSSWRNDGALPLTPVRGAGRAPRRGRAAPTGPGRVRRGAAGGRRSGPPPGGRAPRRG